VFAYILSQLTYNASANVLACHGPWVDVRTHMGSAVIQSRRSDAFLEKFADASLAVESAEGGFSECLLGQICLRIVSLLQDLLRARVPADVTDVATALVSDWNVLQAIGWHAVVRSGWPIFQLLHMLQGKLADMQPIGEPFRVMRDPLDHPASQCDYEAHKGPFTMLLLKHLQHKPWLDGSSLLASSLSYLESQGAEKCALTLSAGFVAAAWSRLPVYDIDTEALLQMGSIHARPESVQSLISAAHPLLEILSRISVAYQAPIFTTAPVPPAEEKGTCLVRSAQTPSGRCNFFAPIEKGLRMWQKRRIMLEDVVRAFRPISDQKIVLFRLIGDDFVQVIPQHSHLDAEFGATEPTCLAHAILDVVAKADIPNFDMVLNHGDLPILRREEGKPPFYGPMDRHARIASPLFGICTSDDFFDILFPNVCRPSLVNMSRMSPIPWAQKRNAVFWRGTDRGAVNWAMQIKDMYRGSPRKRFLDAWGEDEQFNLAFLDDDLLNSTVVNTDPRFVPLNRWPEWRFLLDLPGNGYSGSLKQKLTSSSAVVLLEDTGVPGASAVYEHYHAGLQDMVHALFVNIENAGRRMKWAISHIREMSRIVRNANQYMRRFKELTECYIWHLLTEYSRLLDYQPSHDQLGAFASNPSVRMVKVHRRPLKHEAAAFRSHCVKLLQEYAL